MPAGVKEKAMARGVMFLLRPMKPSPRKIAAACERARERQAARGGKKGAQTRFGDGVRQGSGVQGESPVRPLSTLPFFISP